jgi:hypothetical protein
MKTSTHTIESPTIPAELQAKLQEFITHFPASRFSRNLRTMLLEFMMSSGTEAPYIKDLLLDLQTLCDLLDKIEDAKASQ